jgi:mannose-6-phosphate isomerase-like protein (cupin superfamily)
MPKVSKESAAQVDDHGIVEDRHEDVDGYTLSFVEFRQDIDATPLLKGAPDDRCQCPHWGYVVKGRLTFRYADREELFETGDAFYTPPGHVPVKHEPGTEIVMFSPAEALKETEAVMMKNMQEMQSAGGHGGP